MPNRTDATIAVLIAAFVLLAWYLPNIGPTLLSGDCAELTVLSNFCGIPHATGYPLYIWMAHIFTRLAPWGDVAFRMNLFSGIASAGVCGFLYFVTLCLAGKDFSATARRLAALGATLV